jgi:phospholipid transport system substrate-binding protein
MIRLIPALLVAALAAPALVSQPALANAPAEGGSEATAVFKGHHAAVIALVKKKAAAKTLQSEVDTVLDYDWIAAAALGAQPGDTTTCAPSCEQYTALLTRLIRENYLRLITKAEGHEIHYLGEQRGRTGAAKVNTKMQVMKKGRQQTVRVSYVMHQIGGSWQIRDIITDGVSLAKTYRYEFNQLLKQDGINSIVTKLEEKLASVAA